MHGLITSQTRRFGVGGIGGGFLGAWYCDIGSNPSTNQNMDDLVYIGDIRRRKGIILPSQYTDYKSWNKDLRHEPTSVCMECQVCVFVRVAQLVGVVITILRDLCLFKVIFYGFYHGIHHHESHHHFREYLLLHFFQAPNSRNSKMSRADFSGWRFSKITRVFWGFLGKKKIERILVTDQNPPLEVGNPPKPCWCKGFFESGHFVPSTFFVEKNSAWGNCRWLAPQRHPPKVEQEKLLKSCYDESQ